MTDRRDHASRATIANDGKRQGSDLEPLSEQAGSQNAAAQDAVAQDPCTGDDCRHVANISFYTGLSIDTFAADELARYLNPDESGGPRERLVAGFNLDYRLFGNENSSQQLWVFGETMHGVRSTEVDCEADSELSVCKPFENVITGATSRTLYILRNASSLEGFAGIRWEFARIQPGTGHSAGAYVKAQAGFLTVSGGGGDVVDLDQVSVGIGLTKGPYVGSYLEVGVGRSDLFLDDPTGRLKIDGFLSWKVKGLDQAGVSPFVQIVIDSDMGSGPDSIQTYLGFDFSMDVLFSGLGG